MSKVEIIQIKDLTIHLSRKKIKNINFSVGLPQAKLSMSVPLRASKKLIEEAVDEKIQWIKKQQQKMLAYEKSNPQLKAQEYVEGETHFLWGVGYPLSVMIFNGKPVVTQKEKSLLLCIRDGFDTAKRDKLMFAFYRDQMNPHVPILIDKWQKIMAVQTSSWATKKMKSRWGSCNISDKSINLSLELAKYPLSCLEYVIVHELVHLFERYHNARFYGLMDQFMPQWREVDEILNKGLGRDFHLQQHKPLSKEPLNKELPNNQPIDSEKQFNLF